MGWAQPLDDDLAPSKRRLWEMLRRQGVSEPVIEAMSAVPREAFVPEQHHQLSYEDRPIQIGPDATISAPSMVAAMLDALKLEPGLKVLEVGVGSGYAAATMAALGAQVIGLDIVPELVEQAHRNLDVAGYSSRVEVHAGDGQKGWAAGAPYDRVLVSAAVADIPRRWIEELKPGGFVLYPESGQESDRLIRLSAGPSGFIREDLGLCRFVRLH